MIMKIFYYIYKKRYLQLFFRAIVTKKNFWSHQLGNTNTLNVSISDTDRTKPIWNHPHVPALYKCNISLYHLHVSYWSVLWKLPKPEGESTFPKFPSQPSLFEYHLLVQHSNIDHLILKLLVYQRFFFL